MNTNHRTGGDSIGSGKVMTTVPWNLIKRYRLKNKIELQCQLETCDNKFFSSKKGKRKYCPDHTGVPTARLRREVELNAKKRS